MLFNFEQLKNKNKPHFIIIAIAVVVIATFLIFGKFTKRLPEIDGREFMTGREFLPINNLDQGIKLNGQCIAKYYLHFIGINGGRRHFAITFDLTDDPKDEGQLFNLLATSLCKEEIAKALSLIKDQFPQNSKQDSDVLTYFYRSRSGTRFLP